MLPKIMYSLEWALSDLRILAMLFFTEVSHASIKYKNLKCKAYDTLS